MTQNTPNPPPEEGAPDGLDWETALRMAKQLRSQPLTMADYQQILIMLNSLLHEEIDKLTKRLAELENHHHPPEP